MVVPPSSQLLNPTLFCYCTREYLPAPLSINLSICLSVYVSICLFVYLSVYLSHIYIYVHVYPDATHTRPWLIGFEHSPLAGGRSSPQALGLSGLGLAGFRTLRLGCCLECPADVSLLPARQQAAGPRADYVGLYSDTRLARNVENMKSSVVNEKTTHLK